MFPAARNYSFSPLLKRTPPKVAPRTKPVPAKQYKKYSKLEQHSILFQLIKPTSQLPANLSEYLKFSAIDDFQDFLSQQIHRYIIFNNSRYTGDTHRSFNPDTASYLLTTAQLLDTKLKKAVLVMLNQHLQFLITTIKELSKHFLDDSTQRRDQLTPRTPDPRAQPEHLSVLEKKILQREHDQMQSYLRERQKNSSEQTQVAHEAQLQAGSYLGDMFQDVVSNSHKMALDKSYSESEAQYTSQPKYQLDGWS